MPDALSAPCLTSARIASSSHLLALERALTSVHHDLLVAVGSAVRLVVSLDAIAQARVLGPEPAQ
jgi:hypothetical protein